jgi:hypothetical protein
MESAAGFEHDDTARAKLDARIADILESQFPDIAENRPELLTRHCTEAGLIEKAAGLWGKAGQRSLARSYCSQSVQWPVFKAYGEGGQEIPFSETRQASADLQFWSRMKAELDRMASPRQRLARGEKAEAASRLRAIAVKRHPLVAELKSALASQDSPPQPTALMKDK